MVSPLKSRNRAAILVTAAVIALLVGAALPDAGKGFTLRFVFLMGGLVGITFCGVWLAICWNAARRYTRLKAGEGVITRWTIAPAHWEKFRQQSKEWDRGAGVLANAANLDQTPGTEGIEIVVTGDSLLLGQEFYAFERNVRVQALNERIEFHETLYKRYGPQWHIAYRIPLAPGGQPQGARIAQLYTDARPPVVMGLRAKIKYFLILVASLAALTGLVTMAMHLLGLSR